MPANRKHHRSRLILGYYCRLIYDRDCECYLISCDKFPNLLEDGPDSRTATIRMRCAMKKQIRETEAMGKNLPPVDDPDWKHILRSAGYISKRQKNFL